MPAHPLRYAGSLVVPLLVLGAVVVSGAPADPEVVRLRRHFAIVERELLARDVSQLAPAQREARARHIARLRDYARRGVFPKNTDFPGRLVPYLIDRVGTRCAMANLIEQSGSGDFVSRVAATNNNAYIAELASEPALIEWLDRNGLTVAEAARIQPQYGPCGDGIDDCEVFDVPPRPHSTPYLIGTGVAIAGGLTTIAMNVSLLHPGMSRQTSGLLGIGAGVLGLALGVPEMEGEFSPIGVVNVGVGALSVFLGVAALATPPPKPPAAGAKLRSAAIHAVPWVGPEGAGILVGLRF